MIFVWKLALCFLPLISLREPSLDSVFGHAGPGVETYSETSTPSHGLDGCSPSSLIAKLPESQKDHVPVSPSTLSSSENDQDYPPVVLRYDFVFINLNVYTF